jgi:hypothetical protein
VHKDTLIYTDTTVSWPYILSCVQKVNRSLTLEVSSIKFSAKKVKLRKVIRGDS